eukprot:scaffold251180_cov19-Prasinocladus_malaysianus.AAC.1
MAMHVIRAAVQLKYVHGIYWVSMLIRRGLIQIPARTTPHGICKGFRLFESESFANVCGIVIRPNIDDDQNTFSYIIISNDSTELTTAQTSKEQFDSLKDGYPSVPTSTRRVMLALTR